MAFPSFTTPPDDGELVRIAQIKSRGLGYRHVGSPHVLMALIELPRNRSTGLLRSLALRQPRIVSLMEQIAPSEGAEHRDEIPLNPTARAIVRNAADIARLFGAVEVNSLHYLLGLVAEDDCIAVDILRTLRFDIDEIIERAMWKMGIDTWPARAPRDSPAEEAMSDAEFRKYKLARRQTQLLFRAEAARRRGRLYDAERLRLQLDALKRQEAQAARFELLFAMEGGRLRRRNDTEPPGQPNGDGDDEDSPEDRRSAQD